MLQSIWNIQAQKQSGSSFSSDQIVFAIRGSKILPGGAPLSLLVSKVQTVQSLLYRTVELLAGVPFRTKGLPEKTIQDNCRPWIFQAVPGSYQFTIALESASQYEMFENNIFKTDTLTKKLMQIIRATASESDDVESLIPQEDYRKTFSRLARNLAPNGRTHDEIAIKSSADPLQIVLTPETRRIITHRIRQVETTLSNEDGIQIRGVLRAVDLNKDWLEISEKNTGKTIRIHKVGEIVDDVIGPMVNQNVIVSVVKYKLQRRFLDIDYDDDSED